MEKIFVFLFVLMSCEGHDPCDASETRCAGNTVEICDSDGEWSEWMDCSEIDPGEWTCSPDIEMEGFTCLPVGM